MKQYVCGFVFNDDKKEVVLIRKARPDWQKGLLNGVGGKIEVGEQPVDAMVREFSEEAGVYLKANFWKKFAQLNQSEQKPWVVHFFVAIGTVSISVQDHLEPVGWYGVSALQHRNFQLPACVPNLRWLVPLAREGDVTGQFIQHNWPHPE